MASSETLRQVKALTALIDEADEDIRLNGTVSRSELAAELEALDAEWMQQEVTPVVRAPGR
jgi:hypothetical protein